MTVQSPGLSATVVVRAEEAGDHAAVRQVHLRAFGDAGAKVAVLNDDLRRSLALSPGLSLVAVAGDTVVGHVMFTRGLLDAPSRLVEVQVLSPVGVVPVFQRRGIGAELIRRGVQILSDQGVPLVFLEGDPAYYGRLGFEPGGSHGFRRPSLRIPSPAFQVMLLAGYERWMTGTLVYSDTFWKHDAVGLHDP